MAFYQMYYNLYIIIIIRFKLIKFNENNYHHHSSAFKHNILNILNIIYLNLKNEKYNIYSLR